MKRPESLCAVTHAERLVLLAWALAGGEAVTVAYVQRTFEVSLATAKRDLALLDRVLRGRKLTSGDQERRTIAFTNRPPEAAGGV